LHEADFLGVSVKAVCLRIHSHPGGVAQVRQEMN
jgi:hypothetical protein